MAGSLIKRGDTYSVRYFIKPRFWNLLGKKEIWRTTGTGDKREADRRKHRILADLDDEVLAAIQAATLAAKETAKSNPAATEFINTTTHELRRRMESGDIDSEQAGEMFSIALEEHLKARSIDPDATEALDIDPQHLDFLRTSSRMASNLCILPLREAIEQYLDSVEGRVNNTTALRKQVALERFSAWIGGNPDLADITRKEASAYVTKQLAKNGKAYRTNNWDLSALVTFFNWASDHDLYKQRNPFTNLSKYLKGSTRGKANEKPRAFTDAELVKLLTAYNEKPITAKKKIDRLMCIVGIYTGMRLNEVASIRIEDVNTDDWYIALREAKNENSIRQVPIHSVIRPLVRSLVDSASDEYLIPGMKFAGRDKRRGVQTGKRINRFIHKYVPGRVGYHSFRRSFATRCHNAGIPLEVAEELDGHKSQSLSYGTYSAGLSLEKLHDAMATLDFGEIDKLV